MLSKQGTWIGWMENQKQKKKSVAKDKNCVSSDLQTMFKQWRRKKRVLFRKKKEKEEKKIRAFSRHACTILVVEQPSSSTQFMYHFFCSFSLSVSLAISAHLIRCRSFWFPNDMVIFFNAAFCWLWLCSILFFYVRFFFFCICIAIDIVWFMICDHWFACVYMCYEQTKKSIVSYGHFSFSMDDHGQFSCSLYFGHSFYRIFFGLTVLYFVQHITRTRSMLDSVVKQTK